MKDYSREENGQVASEKKWTWVKAGKVYTRKSRTLDRFFGLYHQEPSVLNEMAGARLTKPKSKRKKK